MAKDNACDRGWIMIGTAGKIVGHFYQFRLRSRTRLSSSTACREPKPRQTPIAAMTAVTGATPISRRFDADGYALSQRPVQDVAQENPESAAVRRESDEEWR